MPVQKPTNPFYIAQMPLGILLGITASAFVVMTMRGRDPQDLEEATGLVLLMQRHGITILVAETSVLAVQTIAAIFSDDYWT